MKKYILVILLVFLFVTGCTKQNKKSINVLNWSSYIPDEIISNFEKEYNIKVNYNTYSSNEELLAKIRGAKEGTYDLIFPSDYMIDIMKNKNMLELIDKTKLSNYSNINEFYLGFSYDEENNYSLPFLAASVVITVNQSKIKEKIMSYNDLLNPKYKNQIVLIDDQRIIIGIALLANGYDMNSTKEEELEIAYKWLKKLKKNIKAFDSDSPKNFLISEEASIGVMWNAEGAIASSMNYNIINVFPKEGFALSIDNFAIPKGSKNNDDVYNFINYILRTDVMVKIIDSYPYKTVNKESVKYLNDSYITNLASNIPDDYISKGIFVKNIDSKVKLYDNIWVKIK